MEHKGSRTCQVSPYWRVWHESHRHAADVGAPTQKEGAAAHLPMEHDSCQDRMHELPMDAPPAPLSVSSLTQSRSVSLIRSLRGVGLLGLTQEIIKEESLCDTADSRSTAPGMWEQRTGISGSEPMTSNPFKLPAKTLKTYDTSGRRPVTLAAKASSTTALSW